LIYLHKVGNELYVDVIGTPRVICTLTGAELYNKNQITRVQVILFNIFSLNQFLKFTIENFYQVNHTYKILYQ